MDVRFKRREKLTLSVILLFLKWLGLSLLVGGVAGLAGVAFHIALEFAAEARAAHGWLLYLLPVAGLAIVACYKLLKNENDTGTNGVLTAIKYDRPVPSATAPLIFVSTFLTHLCGGSAGREGAALQLGGGLASLLSRLMRLSGRDSRMLVMCGVSAGFCALFGTPLTAAIFPLEMVSVGVMSFYALVPCTIASLTAYIIATSLGVVPAAFALTAAPALAPLSALSSAGMGVACAGLSILFCVVIKLAGVYMGRWLPDRWLRSLAGGVVIVGLTLLEGSGDYNGAGMDVIAAAVAGGAVPWAFALKLLFTAVTLSSGYKGGAIVPAFFVGACFGCTVGPLLGLAPQFAAALGLVGVFCGVTNCPITSLLLAAELFGGQSMPLFLLVCAVSYMLSGRFSLYAAQTMTQSKLRPGPIVRE